MKFMDEAKIEVIAGDGGNGCLSFRREKYVPRGGPDGGNGGHGGSVYVATKPGLSTLMDLQYRKRFQAGRGVHGKGKRMHGRRGENITIWVPVGTEVLDHKTGELIADLVSAGEKILVVKGGKGGRGNANFKTPTRQAPRIAEEGEKGESKTIRLELKLLADVGLVGFPNAGKSTLISAISNARPKVAEYPFTTKIPHLGVVKVDMEKSFVIADIPGLMEGASRGAGMGIQFLKHIERTRLLLYLVDVTDPKHPDPIQAYQVLRAELKAYHPSLLEKPAMVILTKMDLPEAREKREEMANYFQAGGDQVYSVSAVKREGLKALLAALATMGSSEKRQG